MTGCIIARMQKYRIKMENSIGVCYSDKDFIDYLNQYICDETSVFILTLTDVYDEKHLPEEYKELPYFNF